MGNFKLTPFASDDELARTVADAWLETIKPTLHTNTPHCVALSGGRISKKLFSEVVDLAKIDSTLLSQVHFFWADERCVPPDNIESNFADAQRLLFEPLKISEGQIHRIRGEDPQDIAVQKATETICRIAPCNVDGRPELDLIFLGIGEDGHVASLFPGEPEAIASEKTAYRAVKNSPKPPPNRVTLSYTTIAAARQVWVLASGTGKEAALRESLRPGGQTPLARVLKLRSQTQIFSDILPK